MERYPEHLSLRDARSLYFARNGLGEDGGYSARWIKTRLFDLVTLPLPNTPGHVRALKYHDLHHVLTGYATDFSGELLIGAWEVGGGCGRHFWSWFLNLQKLLVGTMSMPKSMLIAFSRGRRGRNLYDRRIDDELLSMSVARVREELGLDSDVRAIELAERIAYLGYLIAVVPLILAQVGLAVALVSITFWVLRGAGSSA
jgi:hypothetical protein